MTLDYASILEEIQQGHYRFATITTVAGRDVPLIGVSPQELMSIGSDARSLGLQLALLGSRVVGPRSYQRKLSPVLAEMPLTSMPGRTNGVVS